MAIFFVDVSKPFAAMKVTFYATGCHVYNNNDKVTVTVLCKGKRVVTRPVLEKFKVSNEK